MNKRYDDTLQNKLGKLVTASLAGSIMGIGEIVLFPLDVLKIKSQTSPESLKRKNLFSILKNTVELYRGTSWTAMRNAPFDLFGDSALVHHGILKSFL